MRRCIRALRSGVLLTTLLLSGCATPMQMSSEQLAGMTPDEGVVVGSLQITGGRDVLGRTTWVIVASSSKGLAFYPVVPPTREYSVKASRGGKEEIFVTRLPAGHYAFTRFYQPGFSAFVAETSIRFTVQPGKTTYIGRLVIEFPDDFLTRRARFQILVQDTRDATLAAARTQYEFLAVDAVTDLMQTLPFGELGVLR